jgi:hypothetical protein
MNSNDFECFASTGMNLPETTLPELEPELPCRRTRLRSILASHVSFKFVDSSRQHCSRMSLQVSASGLVNPV